jgi:hypothetical protein
VQGENAWLAFGTAPSVATVVRIDAATGGMAVVRRIPLVGAEVPRLALPDGTVFTTERGSEMPEWVTEPYRFYRIFRHPPDGVRVLQRNIMETGLGVEDILDGDAGFQIGP